MTSLANHNSALQPAIGDASIDARDQGSVITMLSQLTKARLSALVLVTTAIGFILGSSSAVDWPRFVWTLLGTALAAGCANALNQVIEVKRDERMLRTRLRPLPAGALSTHTAALIALCMGIAGPLILWVFVNQIAAALALLTIAIYVLAYTPLKIRTTHNTWVGAVSGAIPPMIGWVGAAGTIGAGAWVLAAILFIWQIPHFLALAWLYRDDYERGGFKMLPVVDRTGRLTCRVVFLTATLMLPLGLLAPLINLAGPLYAVGSLLLGGVWAVLCLRLFFTRSNANARLVFVASILYLPLLLALMVMDRVN